MRFYNRENLEVFTHEVREVLVGAVRVKVRVPRRFGGFRRTPSENFVRERGPSGQMYVIKHISKRMRIRWWKTATPFSCEPANQKCSELPVIACYCRVIIAAGCMQPMPRDRSMKRGTLCMASRPPDLQR
jgi:hypothetical protein